MHPCARDAVIVSPLVAAVVHWAAGRRFDQSRLHHARQRAVHRPYVWDRRFAAGFDVANDSVAVPLARHKAEEDVEFDTTQWQVLVSLALTIHSH